MVQIARNNSPEFYPGFIPMYGYSDWKIDRVYFGDQLMVSEGKAIVKEVFEQLTGPKAF